MRVCGVQDGRGGKGACVTRRRARVCAQVVNTERQYSACAVGRCGAVGGVTLRSAHARRARHAVVVAAVCANPQLHLAASNSVPGRASVRSLAQPARGTNTANGTMFSIGNRAVIHDGSPPSTARLLPKSVGGRQLPLARIGNAVVNESQAGSRHRPSNTSFHRTAASSSPVYRHMSPRRQRERQVEWRLTLCRLSSRQNRRQRHNTSRPIL